MPSGPRCILTVGFAAVLAAGCATAPSGSSCTAPERPAELAEPGLRRWQGQRDTWKIFTAPGLVHADLSGGGSAARADRIAYLRRDRLVLIGPDGSERQSLDLRVDSQLGHLSLASLGEGEDAVLAALVDYRAFDRALLNLYDAAGELVFQQVLPWSCPSLAVDSRDPEGEILLLGCDGLLVANGPPLPVYRRSLAINEALHGAESPNLVEDLLAIAWALVNLDREGEALPYAQRGLAIATETDGDDVRNAEVLNTLGMVETGLGRLEDAASHLHRALGLLVPKHPEAARLESDVHFNLGNVHFREKRWAEAERHYRRSLGGNALPADMAKAAYNLARVYQEQRRLDEAAEMAHLALEKDSVAYPFGHAEVQKDARLYIEILRSAGRSTEARAIEARLAPARAPTSPGAPAR